MKAAVSAGLLVGGLALGATPHAWATFTEQALVRASFSAAVLAPPTAVSTTAPTCSGGSYATQVSWTASASSWLDGYEVGLSTTSGGPYTVVPRPAATSPTATTRTLTGLARRTTYYVVVRTTKSGWRAQSGQVAVTTQAKAC